MFRHPHVQGTSNALLDPFSIPVWLCTLASWVLTVLVLKLSTWVESLYCNSTVDTSWSSTVLTTVGSVSEQGSDVESKSFSWRIVFLFILIQVVLMNNYYGGGIVSSLLAAPAKTIRTVKDLINSQLQVGYEDVNYNRGYFKETTDPLVVQLYKKKIYPASQLHPNEYRIDLGVKKMKDEHFVFHAEQLGAYPFIAATFTDVEICALTEIRLFSSLVGPVYTMVQKGSPYKGIFAYGYRQIWETGLMKYQWLKWQPAKPRCLVTTDVVSVELRTIYFAFYIVGAGVIASVIILLAEKLKYKRDCLSRCRRR